MGKTVFKATVVGAKDDLIAHGLKHALAAGLKIIASTRARRGALVFSLMVIGAKLEFFGARMMVAPRHRQRLTVYSPSSSASTI